MNCIMRYRTGFKGRKWLVVSETVPQIKQNCLRSSGICRYLWNICNIKPT